MKHKIEINERILARIKKELEPLKKKETEARRLWTLGYQKFLNAQKKLQSRIANGLTVDPIDKNGVENKTVKKFWDTLSGWDDRSIEFTKIRDAARKAMEMKKSEIIEQEKILSELLHEYQIQTQQTDGMIEKVFMLNEGVVAALENMDKFLASEVYPNLHEKGTQKTIENSELTKRLVIMTNSITVMDVAKVQDASCLIDSFFARIAPKQEVEYQDETVAMLSDLLKELLDIKIKVKAGPNLSKFLALELSEEKFPELKQAQKLLASATNYARSGLYVRLFTRATKDDKWQPVRQS
jgi:hypothetical protein